MTKVLIDGSERYFDGYMIQIMDEVKKRIENKYDGFIYLFGKTGAGKTTLGFQLAKYLDPTFDLNHVAWSGRKFVELVRDAKPGTALVLDEAFESLSSQGGARKFQQALIAVLSMIRSKRLYLIVISPFFFEINKWIITERSVCALKVYSNGVERGFWGFYGGQTKTDLYHRGKRNYDLDCVRPNRSGRFTHWMPFNEDEYERKKQIAVGNFSEQLIRDAVVGPGRHRIEDPEAWPLLKFLRDNDLLKMGALMKAGEFLKMSPRTMAERMEALDEKSNDESPGAGDAVIDGGVESA